MNLTDPAQPDLAWRGYSGWAMLPSFTICLLLSLVLLTSGWFFEDIRGIGQQVGSLVFFWITGGIWGVQILRWLYRGASYIYRLTPSHLYVDRGFRWLPESPIELKKVARVDWGNNRLTRLFNVGWVCVLVDGQKPVCLSGVFQPSEFAQAIMAAAKTARSFGTSKSFEVPTSQ